MKEVITTNKTSCGRVACRYFLAAFLVSGLLVAVALYAFYQNQSKSYINETKRNETKKLTQINQSLRYHFHHVIADLLYLSKQPITQDFINTPSKISKNRMEQNLTTFSEQKKRYNQLRILDTEGREVLRVNYNSGTPSVVSKDSLQKKQNREYFMEGITLQSNQVYVSRFNLNIEKQKIVRPVTPTIRFATPLFDNQNQKKGMLVLNFIGDILLDELKQFSKLSNSELMLLNDEGYWLCASTPEQEWGFQIEERKDQCFSNKYPNAWQSIQVQNHVQFISEHGLFTSLTIRPIDDLFSNSNADLRMLNPHDDMRRTYAWKLVLRLPDQPLIEQLNNLKSNLTILLLTLLFILMFPMGLLAVSMAKHQLDLTNLSNSAHVDSLTRLPNRSLFMDRLDQTLRQAVRYHNSFAVILINLEGIKGINETLVDPKGNLLMEKISERLEGAIRGSDTAARVEKDEFTVILSTIVHHHDAAVAAEKIIDKLSIPFKVKGELHYVTASIGISTYPQDGEEMEGLLEKANLAMKKASSQGSNSYCFYGSIKGKKSPA